MLRGVTTVGCMRFALYPTLLWIMSLLLLVAASSVHARSDDLLEQQMRQAREQLAPGQPPRVVFAGFAMHSDSTAFRGDVMLAEQVMRQVDPEAVVFKLSNPATGQEHDWPLATRDNIAAVLRAIGERVRPEDKVVLLFTTHGLQNQLAVQSGNGSMEVIHSIELQQWLGPLRGKPTLLLVSACYSGSFMPLLRGPSRIVLTASSADRPSFGCQPESRNTFFVEELLAQPDITSRSLQDVVDQARQAIERRERSMRLKPSQPQAFFGAAALHWSRQPLSAWLKPAQTQ